jgi:Cysteine synthase
MEIKWIKNIEYASKGLLNRNNLKVGNTPLVRLKNLERNNLKLYAKLEFLNPFGSVKDRAVYWMIKKAEEEGKLKEGISIIEPTSGNTGIAMACIAKALGYNFTAVVPQAVSEETKEIIRYVGAELIETPDDLCPRVGKGTDQCIVLAKSLVKKYPDKYFMPNQYENEANFLAHYEGTGPEIWHDTKEEITHFICGIGTGGTITGVGTYLKERKKVKIIAVQPQRNHHIQGLRNLEESGIPEVLMRRIDVIDEWITISDEEAFQAVKLAYEKEKLLIGPSSGAVLAAAMKIVEEGCAVLIFADDALKYHSVFNQFGIYIQELKRPLNIIPL